MAEYPNYSVKCSIENCAHHCDAENYCSLECVTIGAHETDPTMEQCTDCKSFVLK